MRVKVSSILQHTVKEVLLWHVQLDYLKYVTLICLNKKSKHSVLRNVLFVLRKCTYKYKIFFKTLFMRLTNKHSAPNRFTIS